MDQVTQVREKTDIVALIQEFVPLKKAGQNFKANCPFHTEKTPSFVVSPQRQIWHCFGGCQKGGDAFTFLMEYEHIEFPEALRILAQKAGVALTHYTFESGVVEKKEKIYQINHVACEFYHYVLTQHSVGRKALQYLLEKRRIKPQTMNTYMLGFAPYEAHSLVTYLIKKKKFSKDEILDAGLATQYERELKDFFQGRIIFPLYDHRGNIIGFSGRVLQEAQAKSKYINTRETLVYHKGSVFFGLNNSKDAIKKANQAIIMEGEFDVISCFQEGITNTVAVKGTALTQEQVNLISRFAQKITLCFDGDKPGQEAIKRSLPIIEKKGLITTVIIIPDGKDADESIRHNPVAFKQAVKHDSDIYDYLFDQVLASYPNKTAEGKKKIGDELLPMFAHIENEIVKEHHLRKLNSALDISYEAVLREIEKIEKKEIIKKDVFPRASRSREEMLEEYLVALIIQYEDPYILLTYVTEYLSSYTFSVLSYQKLLEQLFAYKKTHPAFDTKKFLQTVPKELLDAFDVCFLLPLPKFASVERYRQEGIKLAKELFTLFLRKKIKMIAEQIKEKEKNGEDNEVLQKELFSIVSLLPKA